MITVESRYIGEDNFPIQGNCLRCGKPYSIYFNGGELGRKECCDYIYEARATGYEFYILKKEVSK